MTRRLACCIPALLALAAAGCDGDDAAAVNAAAITLPSGDTEICAALAIDYRNNVGALSVVGLPSQTVVKDILPGAVSGDAVLRASGGKLYIVNRLVDNITVVDPVGADGQRWRVEMQFSTGPATNPQDIAVKDGQAWVVMYDRQTVDVYDLTHGTPRNRVADVPLQTFDPDGLPQAQAIAIAGDRAYVTLDLLDPTFVPRGVGQVVVVDTATYQPVGTIGLHYANPYNFFQPMGDRLLVVSEGDFSGTTGCIEMIVPGASPQLLPCLVQDADAGGTIGAMAVTRDEVVFVTSTYDAQFHPTSVLRHASRGGALAPTALPTPGQTPSDVAYAPLNDVLVYGDMAAGGLRVWDLAGGRERTTSALDLGLPPAAVNGIVCMPRP